MCGRYSLFSTPDEIALIFRLPPEEVRRLFELRPRFNIAPTDKVAAVRAGATGGAREPAVFHWGLIPAWAQDPRVGARMINARAETVAVKPAFRDAFRLRRCLVLANGFYEWQRLPDRKQPHFICMRSGGPFAFAGLWERWEDARHGPIESCTIVTTEPNDLVRPLHNRMPVILDETDYQRWLDPGYADRRGLESLLRPFPSERMAAHPVSTLVNRPANDVPACIEPLSI